MSVLGYIWKKAPIGHPHVNKDGYIYEHVLVMEEHLGRLLRDGETIHHIDHNRKNNNIENLMLFATNSDHIKYHCGYSVFKNDGVWHADTLRRICCYCGKPYFKRYGTGKYCSKECSDLARRYQFVQDDEIDSILTDLKETHGNFTNVAKKYHVTDNAIRKRLRRRGLPFHSSDYK